MISETKINEAVKRLVGVYNPHKIYLFGSYAWGKPTEDSDLDFFIILEDSDIDRYQKIVDGHKALMGLEIPKDLVVYTKKEFDLNCDEISSFSYKIKREGKVVYAKA